MRIRKQVNLVSKIRPAPAPAGAALRRPFSWRLGCSPRPINARPSPPASPPGPQERRSYGRVSLTSLGQGLVAPRGANRRGWGSRSGPHLFDHPHPRPPISQKKRRNFFAPFRPTTPRLRTLRRLYTIAAISILMIAANNSAMPIGVELAQLIAAITHEWRDRCLTASEVGVVICGCCSCGMRRGGGVR
jgi:hypothetical protein